MKKSSYSLNRCIASHFNFYLRTCSLVLGSLKLLLPCCGSHWVKQISWCCAIGIFYMPSCQISGGYAFDKTTCQLPLGSTISNNTLPEISNSDYCNKLPNLSGLTSDTEWTSEQPILWSFKNPGFLHHLRTSESSNGFSTASQRITWEFLNASAWTIGSIHARGPSHAAMAPRARGMAMSSNCVLGREKSFGTTER